VIAGHAAPAAEVRLLALGDSYTIGEGVAVEDRWPMQLAALLRTHGMHVAEPTIIARTGWTTDELAAAIASTDVKERYDLVTVQIGVNNQYRGRSVDEYRTQFRALLARAIGFAGGRASHVVVVSIPDWGQTPFAARRDRRRIGLDIDAFNAVNRDETARSGSRYVDITTISRRAADEADLVVADKLHPSARMYAEWVRAIAPTVIAALG
jgi:lysophospholipase L1-like esterase